MVIITAFQIFLHTVFKCLRLVSWGLGFGNFKTNTSWMDVSFRSVYMDRFSKHSDKSISHHCSLAAATWRWQELNPRFCMQNINPTTKRWSLSTTPTLKSFIQQSFSYVLMLWSLNIRRKQHLCENPALYQLGFRHSKPAITEISPNAIRWKLYQHIPAALFLRECIPCTHLLNFSFSLCTANVKQNYSDSNTTVETVSMMFPVCAG